MNQTTISISNILFSSENIRISPGCTITWKISNLANTPLYDAKEIKFILSCKATNESGQSCEEIFETPCLFQGDMYQYTFNQEGDYFYQCLIHPGVKGMIQVHVKQPKLKVKKIKPTPIKNLQFSKIRPCSLSGSQDTNDSFSMSSSSCFSFMESGNIQKPNEEQIEALVQNEFLKTQQECIKDRIRHQSIFDDDVEQEEVLFKNSKTKVKFYVKKMAPLKNKLKQNLDLQKLQEIKENNETSFESQNVSFNESCQINSLEHLNQLSYDLHEMEQINQNVTNNIKNYNPMEKSIEDIQFQFQLDQFQEINNKIDNCFQDPSPPIENNQISQEQNILKNRPEFQLLNEQIEKNEKLIQQYVKMNTNNQQFKKIIQKKIQQAQKSISELFTQKQQLIKQIQQQESNKSKKKKKKRNKTSKSNKKAKSQEHSNFQSLYEQEYKENNFVANEILQIMNQRWSQYNNKTYLFKHVV